MRFRLAVFFMTCAFVVAGAFAPPVARGQQTTGSSSAQSEGTPQQRLEVMRSRLETMRRTLNGAIAGLNAKDSGDEKSASPDDPRLRLRGLEKEVGSLISDGNELRGKYERAERFEPDALEKLEAAAKELSDRVDAAMRNTASARSVSSGDAASSSSDKKKKKGSFLGRLIGRGGDDDKYEELVGTVAPGRDRLLFEEATREARKSHFQTARDLYSVIINTYPDSPYLPLSKLAIADTFYLEGTTSALIQAEQSYKDWFDFFPTHPLADDVMLKRAEVEMRRMGLPDRDVSSARKAEQRIKVLFQQFPNSSLRADGEIKLREVQEVLAMHDYKVGNHYLERYFQQKASNPKGAQSRFLDIVKKYPSFSYMDDVLFKLARTYQEEEEPDEAAKYYREIARLHPNSRYAEKAREQLQAMGEAIPAADAEALKKPVVERPGMMGQLMIEIKGATPRTIDKNGILIGADDEARDLIQEAIENGGQLKHSVPTAPVQRRAPARPVATSQTTTAPTTAAPKPATGGGVTIQPTQPGGPRTTSPAAPTNSQALPTSTTTTTTTPATTSTPKP